MYKVSLIWHSVYLQDGCNLLRLHFYRSFKESLLDFLFIRYYLFILEKKKKSKFGYPESHSKNSRQHCTNFMKGKYNNLKKDIILSFAKFV